MKDKFGEAAIETHKKFIKSIVTEYVNKPSADGQVEEIFHEKEGAVEVRSVCICNMYI